MEASGVAFPEPQKFVIPTKDWLEPLVYYPKDRGGGRGEGSHSIPGFLERLEGVANAGVDLNSTRAASLVPEHETMSFLRRHSLERDSRDAISAQHTSYVTEVHRGLLDRVWSLLKNVVRIDRTFEAGVRIPIAELHVPRVSGCKSKYVAKQSASNDVSFKVAARGVGAGGGVVTSVVATQEVEASDECLLITVPVDIQTLTYDVPAIDRSISIVSITRVYRDIGTKRFAPPFHDPCTQDYAKVAQDYSEREKSRVVERNLDFDEHPVPIGEVNNSHEIRRERRFLMSVTDLLEVETHFEASVLYGYKLVADHSYLGYYQERDSAKYYWSW